MARIFFCSDHAYSTLKYVVFVKRLDHRIYDISRHSFRYHIPYTAFVSYPNYSDCKSEYDKLFCMILNHLASQN
jgi:hypothetical protein